MSGDKAKGSIAGGVLLVAGCSIGAASLGLPILSALTGFFPTMFLFAICWLYMLATGLLFLEANLWFKKDISIVTMAGQTLGIIGKAIAWITFLFLFYSLLVAYLDGGASLVSEALYEFTGKALSRPIAATLLSVVFGTLIFCGTAVVDYSNRFFMVVLLFSYFLMVGIGLPHIKTSFLSHIHWSSSLSVIPPMILSFGYHNLIPTLTAYLHHDAKSLKKVIVIGTLIPLFIYLLWECLILGLVSVKNIQTAYDQGDMATRALRSAVGNSLVADLAETFAFSAISTSILGVGISLVDFLADGLHIQNQKLGLTLTVIIPPLFFTCMYPKMFYIALGLAGGVAAVILFGLLPVFMVWIGRYRLKLSDQITLPGGRFSLVAIALFSLFVIYLQL